MITAEYRGTSAELGDYYRLHLRDVIFKIVEYMYVSYHYTQLFNLNKLSHCLAQDSNYVPTITVCHDEANILTEITNMVMVPNKDTKTTTGRKTNDTGCNLFGATNVSKHHIDQSLILSDPKYL